MKRLLGCFLCVLFATICANATLVLHFQSPLRDDAAKSGYFPHVLGAAGGSYNASYGENSTTKMVSDGDGWFTYTWDKTISDFQDWMSFNISLYPDSSDQNYNNTNEVKWKDPDGNAYSFKMSDVFGSDVEVWFYTSADGSYEKSFVPPGSKLIWFKSPWGNRTLPQMILALIRYSCVWRPAIPLTADGFTVPLRPHS